jgi:hypothetical protein
MQTPYFMRIKVLLSVRQSGHRWWPPKANCAAKRATPAMFFNMSSANPFGFQDKPQTDNP